MTTQELINDWCDLELHIINTFKDASELLNKNTDSFECKQIKNIRHLCFCLLRTIDVEN